MEVSFYYCAFDAELQLKKVQEACAAKPDLAIVLPVSAGNTLPISKLLHQAGIPLIFSNTLPDGESFSYCLSWTGPDDWGQTRAVARLLAERIGGAGYGILQHVPQSSAYYSRTWAVVTEIAKTNSAAQCLEKAYLEFDPRKTAAEVGRWLERHGERLKGLYCADDAGYALGVQEALRKAGRDDVTVVAAGASKTGLRLVKEGVLYALSYQSAEGDGALAMKAAVDWFSGLNLEPRIYLPYELIRSENVERFMPGQW